MSRIPVGVIGCGYWGPNLVRNFSACPLTEVVGRLRRQPVRLERVGRTFGHLKLVASLRRAPATAPGGGGHRHAGQHALPLAQRCLEAGLHVLVEKPLAATVPGGRGLVDLAERRGRVLMVDHTYLFSNPVRRIKELVDGGELGDLYYVDSIRINLGLFQHDVNVVWDLAPHDLSIVDHVLGCEARSISAWGCAHADSNIEDMAYVNVDFGERMMANFHVNWLSPVKVRQMIFAGSRKSLIFNELEHHRADQGLRPRHRGGPERRRSDASCWSTIAPATCWSPHIEPGEPLQAVVRHFAECIREGKRPLSDGALGLRVVRLLEAATRSIRAQGGRVVLSNGHLRQQWSPPCTSGPTRRKLPAYSA